MENSFFKVNKTSLEGLLEIALNPYSDDRGLFVKIYQDTAFKEAGLDFETREEFYSVSKKNVMRGLHFQTPPFETVKAVFCLKGRAFQCAVDLRKDSPTYGKHEMIELSSEKRNGAFVPVGFANGFLSREDDTIILYLYSNIYSRDHDSGIHYASANIPWPCDNPLVSKRDAAFRKLEEFKTPF